MAIIVDYSSWEEILFWVTQESILGPLLSNIFLWDISLIMKKSSFASYAAYNTPYVTTENLDKIVEFLEEGSKALR